MLKWKRWSVLQAIQSVNCFLGLNLQSLFESTLKQCTPLLRGCYHNEMVWLICCFNLWLIFISKHVISVCMHACVHILLKSLNSMWALSWWIFIFREENVFVCSFLSSYSSSPLLPPRVFWFPILSLLPSLSPSLHSLSFPSLSWCFPFFLFCRGINPGLYHSSPLSRFPWILLICPLMNFLSSFFSLLNSWNDMVSRPSKNEMIFKLIVFQNFSVEIEKWCWQIGELHRQTLGRWVAEVLSLKHTSLFTVCVHSLCFAQHSLQ